MMAKQTRFRFLVYICFVIVITQCPQSSATGNATSPTSPAGVTGSVSPSPVTTTASQNSNSSNKTKPEATTATTKVPTISSSGAVNTNTNKAGDTAVSSTGSQSSTEKTGGNSSATVSPQITQGTTDNGTESDKNNGTSGETTVTAASAPGLTSNNSNTGDNSSSTVGSTTPSTNVTTTATPNATNATSPSPNTNSSTVSGASSTTVNTTNTGSPNTTVAASKTPATNLTTTSVVASTTPGAKPSTEASSKTPVNTVSPAVSTNTPSSNASLSSSNVTSPTKPTSSNNTATPVTGTANATIATPPTSPANTTMTPSGTTGIVPSTPTTPTNEKVYINEVMVNKHGGFQKIELLKSAAANMSHYAMVIVDGSSNKKEIFYLKDNTTVIQHTNGFVTISVNSTLHVVQNTGTGIAVYDTNSMSNLEAKNWTLSDTGLMDALVIGKTYNIAQNLKTLTTDNNPFVIDPAFYGSLKTISRCSLDYVKNTDMFMLTNSSLGKNNSDKCVAKMDVKKTLALKFNASCDSLNSSMARDMMKFVVKEVNKGCHCGITRLHVKEIMVGCCSGETWLKIQFVIPIDNKDRRLLDSYKMYIDQSPSIKLAKQSYKLDKKCDNMEACCDLYNCCDQPKPLTVSDAGKNVKVTVAAVVSCLVVFLIIVVLVIMYMRRKKTVNYQFRMSRLRDDDEDLMMDGAEGDDFVGGQEATFDIKT